MSKCLQDTYQDRVVPKLRIIEPQRWGSSAGKQNNPPAYGNWKGPRSVSEWKEAIYQAFNKDFTVLVGKPGRVSSVVGGVLRP